MSHLCHCKLTKQKRRVPKSRSKSRKKDLETMIEIIETCPHDAFEVYTLVEAPLDIYAKMKKSLKDSDMAKKVIKNLHDRNEVVGVYFITNYSDSLYYSPEVLKKASDEMSNLYSGGIAVINVKSPMRINNNEYLHISFIHELGHSYQRVIGMFNYQQKSYIELEEDAIKEKSNGTPSNKNNSMIIIENDNIQGCEQIVCKLT